MGLAAGVCEAERFKARIIGEAGLVEKDDPKAIEKYQEYIRGYQQRIPIYNQGIEAATTQLKETLGENVNDYVIERCSQIVDSILLQQREYWNGKNTTDPNPTLSHICW